MFIVKLVLPFANSDVPAYSLSPGNVYVYVHVPPSPALLNGIRNLKNPPYPSSLTDEVTGLLL